MKLFFLEVLSACQIYTFKVWILNFPMVILAYLNFVIIYAWIGSTHPLAEHLTGLSFKFYHNCKGKCGYNMRRCILKCSHKHSLSKSRSIANHWLFCSNEKVWHSYLKQLLTDFSGIFFPIVWRKIKTCD